MDTYPLLQLFILLAALTATCYAENFEFVMCGNTDTHMLEVDKAEIVPFPVVMPGHHNVSFKGRINRQVEGASLSLSITRLGSWFNLPIPCILNFGSCSYDDICTLIQRMETENWLGVAAGIATQLKGSMPSGNICPIPTAEIDEFTTFDVPQLPSILSMLTNGDYEVHAEMYDTDGVQVVCIDVRVSVRPAASDEDDGDSWWSIL